MVIKKSGFFIIIVIISFIFCLHFVNASLGITPSKYEVNFQSNLEQDFLFKANSDDPNQKIRIYSSGDLSKYVSFDKEELIGSGQFIASVKLPEKLDNYGRNPLIIGVEELIDEELAGIGTKVRVQAPIYIDVAYPGKYLEVFVSGEDVNTGEEVDFELEIRNKGVENLTIKPRIEIFSESKIETLEFNERSLSSQEEIKLQKSLSTLNYLPGDYEAKAVVEYGEEKEARTSFRIGSLFVRVINHTSLLTINKKSVSKFLIEIENRWNNKIDGVYADTSFFDNNSFEVANFKTSPINLNPWEKGILEGYIETNNFSEGDFYANISLYYHGQLSNKIASVRFIESKPNYFIICIVIIFVGVIFMLSFKYFKKIKNGKKKIKKA